MYRTGWYGESGESIATWHEHELIPHDVSVQIDAFSGQILSRHSFVRSILQVILAIVLKLTT
jgi:hypothetical protein